MPTPGSATPTMGMPATAHETSAAAKANVMTMMAGSAMGVSQAFNGGFKRPFPGWTAELAEPVGPSTGGGKQALQPITIMSGAGERLTIGRVDPVRRSVALRSYHVVNNMHLQRYDRAIPVSVEDYDKFMKTVGIFFKAMQFGLTEEKYVSPMPSLRPTAGGDRNLVITLYVLIAVVIGLVAYIVATR